jgi:putative DNA primase/helicase
MNHITQFAEAIAAAGIDPPDHIEDDGEIHRFPTNGKASDNSGWYVLHGDGVAAGRFGCFRAGVEQSFRADIGRPLSIEEQAENKRRMETARRRRDAEILADRRNAQETALALWARAGKPNGHAYLKRKQVDPFGVREIDGMVVVPVYNAAKQIVGLQRIFDNGEKRFLKGTPVAGNYMSIGKDPTRIVVCEGWATGCSIHMATERTVVVAFNSGNLLAVARLMRSRYPEADIVIAADNDQFTDGNPGLAAGRAAAAEIEARMVYPLFDDLDSRPTDFNDLHVLAGLDAVRAAFDHPAPDPEHEPEPVPEPEPPPPPVPTHAAEPAPVTWRGLALALNDKGAPLQNLDNAVRALEGHPELAGRIWYDEFLDSVVTSWAGPERRWKDADDVLLTLFLQRHVGLTRVGVQCCHDAALVAAFHDVRNECKAYLESTVWDGVPRLAYLMSEGFGAEENAYTQAVGRCWVTSMVARVFRPGCKVDTVPVFEGLQGAGKSSGLAILGGKWFVEAHEPATSKDFFEVLRGHMLVEISEMHSFSRSEVERIKGVISCQVDRYRKAYGRNTEDHPRQTVLACTTNRDDWQKDDTGARRFWPVACSTVSAEWLTWNRDQVFAEAVALFKAGASWWDVPVEQQRDEVESRRMVDAWESTIEEWIGSRDRVQSRHILSDCLQIDLAKQDDLAGKRVARVMRTLGWKQHVLRDPREKGKKIRTWIKNA